MTGQNESTPFYQKSMDSIKNSWSELDERSKMIAYVVIGLLVLFFIAFTMWAINRRNRSLEKDKSAAKQAIDKIQQDVENAETGAIRSYCKAFRNYFKAFGSFCSRNKYAVGAYVVLSIILVRLMDHKPLGHSENYCKNHEFTQITNASASEAVDHSGINKNDMSQNKVSQSKGNPVSQDKGKNVNLSSVADAKKVTDKVTHPSAADAKTDILSKLKNDSASGSKTYVLEDGHLTDKSKQNIKVENGKVEILVGSNNYHMTKEKYISFIEHFMNYLNVKTLKVDKNGDLSEKNDFISVYTKDISKQFTALGASQDHAIAKVFLYAENSTWVNTILRAIAHIVFLPGTIVNTIDLLLDKTELFVFDKVQNFLHSKKK